MTNEIECRSCGQHIAFCSQCGVALGMDDAVAEGFRKSLFELAVREQTRLEQIRISDSLWTRCLTVANISQHDINHEIRLRQLAAGLTEVKWLSEEIKESGILSDRQFGGATGFALVQTRIDSIRKTLLSLFADEVNPPTEPVNSTIQKAVKQLEDLSYDLMESLQRFQKRSSDA